MVKGTAIVEAVITREQAELMFALLLNYRAPDAATGMRRGVEGMLLELERLGEPIPDEAREAMLGAGMRVPVGMYRFITQGVSADKPMTSEDIRRRRVERVTFHFQAWWLGQVMRPVLMAAARGAAVSDLRSLYLPLAKGLGLEVAARRDLGFDGGDNLSAGDAELDLPVAPTVA